jgi:hypothetical protein
MFQKCGLFHEAVEQRGDGFRVACLCEAAETCHDAAIRVVEQFELSCGESNP